MRQLYLRWFCAVGVVCAVSACADVNKLRDAQAAFNDASTAETQVQLAPYTSGSVNVGDLSLRASAGYARTVAILKGLSAKETDQLKADKLLGNALTIEALSYWRLKDYDNAAKVAASIDPSSLYTRDAAMVAALPGLIENSEANADINFEDPGYSFKTVSGKQCLFGNGTTTTGSNRKNFDLINGLLDDAIQKLDDASGRLTPDEPVYAYLQQAHLAAFRNKLVAYVSRCTTDSFPAGAGARPVLLDAREFPTQDRDHATQSLKNFYCSARNLPTTDSQVKVWMRLDGLGDPSVGSCP